LDRAAPEPGRAEHNPYAPPRAALSSPASDPEQAQRERIRREHIGLETRIRGLGGFWVLSGGAFSLLLLSSIVMTLTFVLREQHYWRLGETLFYYAIFLAGGLAFVWTGIGLRRLDARARIAAVILSLFSLVIIPFGTMLGLYGLYILNIRKGRTVFTPEYALIREATPEIRYRSGKGTIVAFLVVLGLTALLFWYLWTQL